MSNHSLRFMERATEKMNGILQETESKIEQAIREIAQEQEKCMRHNQKSLSAEGSLRCVFRALFWELEYIPFTQVLQVTKLSPNRIQPQTLCSSRLS